MDGWMDGGDDGGVFLAGFFPWCVGLGDEIVPGQWAIQAKDDLYSVECFAAVRELFKA